MSATHMGWTFEHSPYRNAAFAVHLALADSANDMHYNELWASQTWIAKKSRASRSTVNEALARMVADGFLEVLEDNSREGRPNRYRFMFPDVEKVWQARRGVSPNTTGGVAEYDRGVSPDATGGVPKSDTNPREPNPEPNANDGGARRAGSETDPDVARAFTEFWNAWTPTGTRGKGPRKAAQERFAKLGPKLRERMLTTTRGYLAMCESQQRATVDCATWLGTGDKSWRAWEDEFAAETVTIRDDYATLPPAEWTAEERALVARQAAERPPDMWEPAVLRLLIHERPDGTEVRNTLGTVPFPPASDTPGVGADDGTLMAWWAERRSAAA